MRSSPCFRCLFLFLCLALLAAPASAGTLEGPSFLDALWEAVLDVVTDVSPPDPEEPKDDDGGDRGSELDPDG